MGKFIAGGITFLVVIFGIFMVGWVAAQTEQGNDPVTGKPTPQPTQVVTVTATPHPTAKGSRHG